MTELAVAAVLCAAFVAGLVDAMVGGGGLVQLPTLLATFPTTPPPVLLGTSKLAGVFGTASAAWRYSRAVRIPWRLIGPACVIAFLASLGGAATVTHVSPDVFRPLVPVILAIVLIYTLVRRDLGAVHAPRELSRGAFAAGFAVVAAIGFYDGFFGPGTGSFLMLLFIRWYGFDFVNAAASARVLNVATNASALAWFTGHGHVMWGVGLAMAAANVAGSQIGTRLALRRGAGFVRGVFVLIVAALIVKTAWDATRVLRAG